MQNQAVFGGSLMRPGLFANSSTTKKTQREDLQSTLVVGAVGGILLSLSLLSFILLKNGNIEAEQKIQEPAYGAISEETVQVLVPLQPIPSGTILTGDLFKTERRLSTELPVGHISTLSEVQGLYSRAMLSADEPFSKEAVSALRPNPDVASNIPPGFRAVSIRVDARTSVEGWARPGARVDVVWTSKIDGRDAITVIAENAKILSAEREARRDVKISGPTPSTVTLLVPMEAANRIQLAATNGTLSLSLRGDNDSKSSAGGTLTIDDLFGIQRVERMYAEPQNRAVVKVREHDGSQRSYSFNGDSLVDIEHSKL